MPKRIQRKRERGWRLPDNAVVVTRPTKWGNPFLDDKRYPNLAVDLFRLWLTGDDDCGMSQRKAAILGSLDELRGKDICCWCSLDRPCHGDVLLDLANVDSNSSLE